MERCLELATVKIPLKPGEIARAEKFEKKGLKPIDALHLSCAEAAGCDFFVTCDDGILGKNFGAALEVVGPEELVRRIDGGSK
jgi:predicted nucleic acid-binding protein